MQNYKRMLKTMLLCVLIIAISIALLAIKIILEKNGRFPNTHICGNKEMRKRGIGSAQDQDRLAQIDNPHAIPERR